MSYTSQFQNDEIDLLFRAVLSLENEEACYRFFEDLCTVNELKALSQRFHIAKLISEGRTYQEIEALTASSAATISRINRCYRYGANGYRTVIDNIFRTADRRDR